MSFVTVVSRAALGRSISRGLQPLAAAIVLGALCWGSLAASASEREVVNATSKGSAASTMDVVTVSAPRNATAHAMGSREYLLMLENLGDLYTRMAAQVYGEAAQLDSSRAALLSKLALVQQVLASVGMPVPMAPRAKVMDERSVLPSVPEPLARPAVGGLVDSKRAIGDVVATVVAWALAWEAQDLPTYYAAYSPQFEPLQGTLEAWKKERRERIVGRTAITVDLNDLQVQVSGDTATVSFHQVYESGAYKSHAQKLLQLRHENGQWRIVREESVS